jgi:hypothetical protein
MSRQIDAIKSWLALEAWRYGHKFGPRGPGIIARILDNRVKRGWGTWSQVLNDIPKFLVSFISTPPWLSLRHPPQKAFGFSVSTGDAGKPFWAA